MSINRKRGSIALARQLCYQINGAADDSNDISAGGGYGSVDIAEILSGEVVRLREALAQRTWVGLTDVEIEQAIELISMLHGDYATEVAYSIEAKLKEKNT